MSFILKAIPCEAISTGVGGLGTAQEMLELLQKQKINLFWSLSLSKRKEVKILCFLEFY